MKIKKKLTPKQKEKILCALRNKQFRFTKSTLHEIQGTEHAYCALGVIGKVFTGKDIEGGSLNLTNVGRNDWRKIPAALKVDGVQETIYARNDNSKSYKSAANWIEKNL